MGVLSKCWRGSRRQALRTLRKGLDMLRRRKHGTTGRLALPHQYRRYGEIAETVRSAPGRDPRMARFIRILRAMARESGHNSHPRVGGAGNRRRLDITVSCGVFRPDFRDFITASKGYSGASMTAAFTFPGQGSQAVGMGKALAEAFPAARAVFDEVDAALGEKLTAIIWDGPAETLQLTKNAQPALMA